MAAFMLELVAKTAGVAVCGFSKEKTARRQSAAKGHGFIRAENGRSSEQKALSLGERVAAHRGRVRGLLFSPTSYFLLATPSLW